MIWDSPARSVVISGIGIVSPLGIGLEAFWEALANGRSGISRITRFDPSDFPCQIGGEVRDRSYEAPGCVRMTVGTREQTRRLLAALEELWQA